MHLTFHFLRIYWLTALIPVLVIWTALYRKQDYFTQWSRVIAPHLLKHLIYHAEEQPRIKPVYILLLIWILTVFALAGPSFRNEPSPFADDQAGLFIILKVTPSMTATDIQPSRLERAKQKIKDILNLREGAATGLIVYSGSSHTVMPLTRDNTIINNMLEGITPAIMPKDGDDLASAVKLAADLLQDSSGSILVIADSIAPSEVNLINSPAPLQFLAAIPQNMILNQGLHKTASLTKSPVTRITLNKSDIDKITNNITRSMNQITDKANGSRPKDAGYLLLPLIALCALMWSRKGWEVK